jgi:NAD(P)-dependent dehydrogenase (short-subunit alcohol dehydrogenase family)
MMARALAANGAAKVYIIGRRKEKLEEVAKSVPTGNIIPLAGDITSKDSLASIASTIASEVGYINVLVANSGTLGAQSTIPVPSISSIADFQKAWGDTTFEEYTETFRINSVGVWFSVVSFLGLLDAGNKKGNVVQTSQVIVTTSIASFHRMVPGGFAYGQSKAAATHLVKQLATQLVPYKIRSNAIAPGCKSSNHRNNTANSGPPESHELKKFGQIDVILKIF